MLLWLTKRRPIMISMDSFRLAETLCLLLPIVQSKIYLPPTRAYDAVPSVTALIFAPAVEYMCTRAIAPRFPPSPRPGYRRPWS